MLKVKRSNRKAANFAALLSFTNKYPLALFFATIPIFIYIGYISAKLDLPSKKLPIVFYSSENNDDLKNLHLQAIAKAKKSIFLIIYGLTDPEVIDCINNKIDQGIDVKIFYDINGSRNLKNSIPHNNIFPLKSNGIMHKKVLVIDNKYVYLGSANLTQTSLRLHDNLVMGCKDKGIAHFFKYSLDEKYQTTINDQQIEIWSLPDQNKAAEARVIEEIKNAKKKILICMFTFTNRQITQQLIEAKKRGVEVEVALDYYSSKGASKKNFELLCNHLIPVYVAESGKLLHHKWCLIDEKTFIFGSTNWTKAAFEKNDDTLIFISPLKDSQIKIITRKEHFK